MIHLQYFGHSCFAITSAAGKTIITDPYQGVGYELPKGLRAEVVTVSHGHFDHNYVDGVACKRVISTLQPYEEEGIRIEGIESYHDGENGSLRGKNIVYKITVDGVIFCHLGDIGEEISPALLKKIGKVDILFLPVGGRYTVDATQAKAYVDVLLPKVTIPMHYKPQDGSLDIASAQPFLSLCDKYTTARGSMEIDENTQGVYYMERM